MPHADRLPVKVTGGWGGDEFRIEVEDPHNGIRMVELTIPLDTFTDALRNYCRHDTPLGTLRVFPRSFDTYGYEQQVTTLTIPLSWEEKAKGYDAFVAKHLPDGWHARDRGWNHHHMSKDDNGDRVYLFTISRTVPHGTPAVVEGWPDANVRIIWSDSTLIEQNGGSHE